jgi:anti-sigma factor ChrR (cupin superfamily)
MNQRSVIAACLAVLLSVVLLSFQGCGYGEVSPATYQYSKALYCVCNRRSAADLDRIQAMIDQSLQDQEISAQESGWLTDIVNLARQQQWTQAAAEARQMMRDQVSE